MDIDKKLVGTRIKQLRLEHQMTQENLASLLGLKGKSSISNYESGKIIPSDKIKLHICDIFNCPMEYLMGISDSRVEFDYDAWEKKAKSNEKSINLNKVEVAFANGYKGLNETNKMIIKNTLEALLAKQEKDEEKKK